MTQPNIEQDLEKLLASAHTLHYELFGRKSEIIDKSEKFELDKLKLGSGLEVFTNQLTYTIAQLILLEDSPSKKLEKLEKLMELFEELLPESRSDWKKAHGIKKWINNFIQEFSSNEQPEISEVKYQRFPPP